MIALAFAAIVIGTGWVILSLITVDLPPADWEDDDWR